MQHLLNERLDSVLPDWPGNPYRDGQFRYLDEPFQPSWRKLLRWQLGKNPQKAQKKADDWRPAVQPGAVPPPAGAADTIVWLGHACFLLQLNGRRLITDPVFFDLPFVPRRTSLPYPLEHITGLDYILLSHDHRDHCDRKSLQSLLRHNRPRKLLTALNMSEVIGGWLNGHPSPVEEAAWYQVYDTGEEVEVIFLPARHWCRRSLFDFNRRLWGSFLIRAGGKTVYFGADSGYAGHFREIGQLFPDIDLALIGIGAYKPPFMMGEIHTSPEEALQAFRDLGARRLLPMHYGTYDLSDEPPGEPYRRIRELFAKEGMGERLVLPKVGEVVEFS